MFRPSVALCALALTVMPGPLVHAQQPEPGATVDATTALHGAVCANSDPDVCVQVQTGSDPLVLRLQRQGLTLDLRPPSSFSASATVRIEGLHDSLPLQGGITAWRIEATESDRSFEWLVEQRSREFYLLWFSPGGEDREHLRAEDLDGDGDGEIVVAIPAGTAGRCGTASPWLAPRVYDTQRETFRPISMRVSAADAALLTPVAESLRDQFPQDATAVFVSSDASNGLTQSWGAPPAALADGDTATFWTEAAAGSGAGQFVTFRTLPQIGVYGLQVDVGNQPGIQRLLVRLPDDRTFVTPELPSGASSWEFPDVFSGSCLQVAVLQVSEDAEHATLAELNLLTELDRRPVETALDLYVLPALLRTTTPMERGILQDVVASAGDDALTALLQAIEDTEGDEQGLLLDTLMRLNAGPDAMLALFDTLEVDVAGYRRLAASWPDTRTLPEDWLDRFKQALPSEQTGWLILMTRLQPDFSLDELWPVLDLTHEPTRLALSDYLTAFDSPAALLVSDAAAAPDPDRQKLVYRSAWRRIRHEQTTLDGEALQIVRTTATTSTDGGVARYAVAILGESGDPSDVALLQSMLNDDPEPVMRRQAAESLAALAMKNIGNAPAVFESALSHEDPGVRLHAAAIAARSAELSVSSTVLGERLAAESWPETQRQVAAAALGRARSAEDVAVVLTQLGTWPSSTASSVLRHLPDADGMVDCDGLLQVVDAHPGSEPVVVAVALAMGRCQGGSATDWLRAQWRGEASSARLAQAALESAVLRGDDEAVDQGLAMLGSTDPEMRRNGALALHRSARDVSDALNEALMEETDPTVIRALRTALGLPAEDGVTTIPEW